MEILKFGKLIILVFESFWIDDLSFIFKNIIDIFILILIYHKGIRITFERLLSEDYYQ
jgi:hypothetical protein